MVGTTGFHGDVNCRVTEVYAVVRAVIGGLDDVCTVLCQNSGKPMQGTRIIWEMHAQPHQASILYQAALHDARKQADVNVAAANQNGNLISVQ